jgi:hypothetical protein
MLGATLAFETTFAVFGSKVTSRPPSPTAVHWLLEKQVTVSLDV